MLIVPPSRVSVLAFLFFVVARACVRFLGSVFPAFSCIVVSFLALATLVFRTGNARNSLEVVLLMIATMQLENARQRQRE